VDVYGEHMDVAVRIADSIDPGLVAIKLAPYRRVFCASPAYLRDRGSPRTPEDLAHHDCLFSRGAGAGNAWPVLVDGRVRSVQVAGRLVANHAEPIRDAVLAGLGVCMTARWLVEAELRQGLLVEVLAEHAVQNRAIYAVLSQRGAMTPKVRAFVDFLRECLSDLQ
jgi:DNA-binding transcriptional LysR family regulator